MSDRSTLSPMLSNACPGLFYRTVAADGFLHRIRVAGGMLSVEGAKVLIETATALGVEDLQITNRGNIQMRSPVGELPPEILARLQQVGLAAPIPAVDSLRNIMMSPMAGIDGGAVADTRSIVRELDRSLSTQGRFAPLSAKFSIGIDGAESVSIRHRHNDVWAIATPAGYRLALSTERDLGLLLAPEDCVAGIIAIADAYLAALDRITPTPTVGRKSSRPRLREAIEHVGEDWFIESVIGKVNCQVGQPEPLPDITARNRFDEIGILPQSSPDLTAIGIAMPLGKLSLAHLQALIYLPELTEIRLTVGQNILLPDLPTAAAPAILNRLQSLGLAITPHHPASAIVACAGLPHCQSSHTDTQALARTLIDRLDALQLDRPINIHVSGCPKACAQPYDSDLALLGLPDDRYEVYTKQDRLPFGHLIRTATPTSNIADAVMDAIEMIRSSPSD